MLLVCCLPVCMIVPLEISKLVFVVFVHLLHSRQHDSQFLDCRLVEHHVQRTADLPDFAPI